ncbi:MULTISPECIES: rod shape-determining protein MreD [Pasteurellaceae]|uniref:Rod shape-determining protein MreD n=1 Tax=Pasteurella bettyae CCUG 2042 TaxID=1095749 RepID=I3DH72_9PAST|nr:MULTISPECIES: rod shape-determining protein MreD [Pasteurellaceae]EIJ71065.1 rod shape-determining protein MreD [Pasteurella bettyae CCUG 2042]SUB22256.1 rod shape-determining protein MreD [Pasteurella bettyae]
MKGHFLVQLIVVLATFVVALVLEITPWPSGFHSFKPSWLVLVLTYWILALPTRINIGTAFLSGVIWDVVLGTILGVHALVLSLAAYLVARYNQILRNLSLWQQSLLIIIFILLVRIGIFLLELSIHSAVFSWKEIFGALISAALWPWVFFLLRKIQHQIRLD